MLQLVGSVRNIQLFPQSNPVRADAIAEVVLIMTERDYSISETGHFVSKEKLQHTRFYASKEALRQLATHFAEMADDMAVIEKSVVFKLADESLAEMDVPQFID